MKNIFISSTFKDMQAERDLLHFYVFPRLRERLAESGEEIRELDLRWGVDTSTMSEEESGRSVIRTCVDAIDRCHPYMIVLLGERYGWIPGSQAVAEVHDDRISHIYEQESSITHLEIIYGALQDSSRLEKCIFLFRDPAVNESIPEKYQAVYRSESPLHARKLAELKAKIRSRKNARILEYSPIWDEKHHKLEGFEALAQELTEVLAEILQKDLKNLSGFSDQEKILRDAANTRRQFLSSYIIRSRPEQIAVSALTGSRVWLTSPGGMGKSTLMARFSSLAEENNIHTFLYFAGNSGCKSTAALALALGCWLRKERGKPEDTRDFSGVLSGLKLDLEMQFLMLRVEKERRSRLLLIDGLDQMDTDIRDFLAWLIRNLPPETALIVSSLPDFYYHPDNVVLAQEFSNRELKKLEHTEIDAIVQKHASLRGKKIDEAVRAAIRKKEGASNPYYLSLLLQQLFMMNQRDFEKAERIAPGMEGLSAYMQQLVAGMPEAIDQMTLYTLELAAAHMSDTLFTGMTASDGAATARRILQYLAASRDGLSVPVLLWIFALEGKQMPPVFAETLFLYLYDAFRREEDGRITFKHRILQENILAQISAEELKKLRLKIAEGTEAAGILTAKNHLYYAWKTGNLPMGVAVLTTDMDNLYDMRNQIWQIADEDRKWLSDAAEQLPDQNLSFYYRLLESLPNELYRHYAGLRPAVFQQRKLAAETECWQRFVQMRFREVEPDTKETMNIFRRTCDLLEQIPDPGEYILQFTEHCRNLFFLYDRLQDHILEALRRWEPLISRIQADQASRYDWVHVTIPHELHVLQLFSSAGKKNGSEKTEILRQIGIILDQKDNCLTDSCRNQYQAELARQLARENAFEAAYERCSNLRKIYKSIYDYIPGYDAAYYYVLATKTCAACVKPVYQKKYYLAAKEVLETQTDLYPVPAACISLCDTLLNLAALEQSIPSEDGKNHDLQVVAYLDQALEAAGQSGDQNHFYQLSSCLADNCVRVYYEWLSYLSGSCHLWDRKEQIARTAETLRQELFSLYRITGDSWYADWYLPLCSRMVIFYAALGHRELLALWCTRYEEGCIRQKQDPEEQAYWLCAVILDCAQGAFLAGFHDLTDIYLTKWTDKLSSLSIEWIRKKKMTVRYQKELLRGYYLLAESGIRSMQEGTARQRALDEQVETMESVMNQLELIRDNRVVNFSESIWFGCIRLQAELASRKGNRERAISLLTKALGVQLRNPRSAVPGVEVQAAGYQKLLIQELFSRLTGDSHLAVRTTKEMQAVYQYSDSLEHIHNHKKEIPFYRCFIREITTKQ